MDRKEWIREVLVKNILETYKPWRGAEVVGSVIEQLEGNKDNFASLTYSVTVNLIKRNEGENIEAHPIFCKFMIEIPAIREALQIEKQFQNEVIWYSKVVPQFQLLTDSSNNLRSLIIFPKCYFANYDVKNAVVALEDLRPKNFGLGDRNALDIRHVEKALAALARSHALAYIWREKNENDFMEVANSFKEAKISDSAEPMLKMANERVMKALEKDPKYAERVKRFREVTATPVSLLRRLVKPEGPLATLCHGDFCRNNILFSENSMSDDTTLEAILIDFQTARFASPAIDLSFFFFLSVSPQLRTSQFDNLFRLYHDSLINDLKALSENKESIYYKKRNEYFSLQAFKDDFAAHAVYGYIITAFFLPLMLSDDETREDHMRKWENNDTSYLDTFLTAGGEPVTVRLVHILKEILDRGYWPLGMK